jgi:hypothetical protein
MVAWRRAGNEFWAAGGLGLSSFRLYTLRKKADCSLRQEGPGAKALRSLPKSKTSTFSVASISMVGWPGFQKCNLLVAPRFDWR